MDEIFSDTKILLLKLMLFHNSVVMLLVDSSSWTLCMSSQQLRLVLELLSETIREKLFMAET
jgi:hypothetical protein